MALTHSLLEVGRFFRKRCLALIESCLPKCAPTSKEMHSSMIGIAMVGTERIMNRFQQVNATNIRPNLRFGSEVSYLPSRALLCEFLVSAWGCESVRRHVSKRAESWWPVGDLHTRQDGVLSSCEVTRVFPPSSPAFSGAEFPSDAAKFPSDPAPHPPSPLAEDRARGSVLYVLPDNSGTTGPLK
jgi:hypothetical protein